MDENNKNAGLNPGGSAGKPPQQPSASADSHTGEQAPGAPEGNVREAHSQESHAQKAAPPQPGPAMRQPQPVTRRVGTLTLGIALILCGLALLAKILLPNLNVLLLLRFSPVVLILLGLEMLAAAAKPGEKLRYDWLSLFVSFVLVCAAGCAAVMPYVLDYYGPFHEEAETRLRGELNEAAYEALRESCPQIEDVSVQLYLSNRFNGEEAESLTLATLPKGSLNYAQAYVTLGGAYGGAEAFAADCRAVLDAAQAAGLPFTCWRFDTLHDSSVGALELRYDLYLEGPWKENASAESLARLVEMEYWYNGSCYDSLESWQAATAETAQAENAEEANAYQQGYQSGYEEGYSIGRDEGYTEGYDVGSAEAGAAVRETVPEV